MALTPWLCFLLLWISPAVLGRDVPAPVYTINLDLPPEERWAGVLHDYSTFVQDVINTLVKMVPKEAVALVNVIGKELEKYLPYPYAGEIRGVAKYANVTVGEALVGNLLYELTAFGHRASSKACTSIVAETVAGTIFHGRNLDYGFTADLRKSTIVANFQQNGVTLYTGTTFAGYVGLLTGQKPNQFTLSLDERDKGEIWENILAALITGKHGIVSFHLRDVLGDPHSDYESALELLSTIPLITPSYIIVGGSEPTEGAVITRDRTAALDVWKLDPTKGQWYVLETNYDHWVPPPPDDDRRDPGIKAMNDTGRENLSGDTLFKVLSTHPVLNDGTTYTTIMSAAQPDLYHTVIRFKDTE